MATEADVVAEARRLMKAAAEASIPVRLLGGVAVVLRTPNIAHTALQRDVKDIDLVTPSADRWRTAQFLEANGYTPDKEFNAFQGRRRLLFFDRLHDRQLDVFVGEFSMCHVVPLAGRLELDPDTLSLADLVLTKLQIVKLNEKDRTDLYRLLLGHDVADSERGISAAHVAAICSRDWGLERTLMLNLERLRDGLDIVSLPIGEKELIRERLDRLADAVNRHPKSTRWRLRAVVGERVQWYEDPDEP